MPRKNAMRDNVSAVRSRLPHLFNLSREKIELALLYYESNVDETVEAFKTNGAIEALSGWTEMSNARGNSSIKRTNNKSAKSSSSQVPPSNGILRPSQRVSNIFQTFAEGGTPTLTPNTTSSSSSLIEQSNQNFQPYPSNDLSFHPYLSQDSTTNNSQSLLNVIESTDNEFHDTSNATTNSSATVDELNSLINHIDRDDCIITETNGHNGKTTRRKNSRNRNGSTSSNHDQAITTAHEQTTNNSIPSTVSKSSTSHHPTTTFSDNRKILTKSTKDLQRQTSTLTNVELSFDNEMKSSIKRIDDVFKQIREIIKQREVDLYLEMDQVREQGLNVIHRRQQRAIELRQRIDRCDQLQPFEIDNLRTDIKQFVTDRRYDLGEELTSSHRFEYDQTLVETLKNFGKVLRIDRKDDRGRTKSTSSTLGETNGTTTEKPISDKSLENVQIPLTNGRTPLLSSSSNEMVMNNNQQQQPLPQRVNKKQNLNGNTAGDYSSNSYYSPQTNGYYPYYDDTNNYQTANRRRPPPQQQQQYSNGNTRRTRPVPSSANNNRRPGINNNETTNTYRRPRPPQSIVPPVQPISN